MPQTIDNILCIAINIILVFIFIYVMVWKTHPNSVLVKTVRQWLGGGDTYVDYYTDTYADPDVVDNFADSETFTTAENLTSKEDYSSSGSYEDTLKSTLSDATFSTHHKFVKERLNSKALGSPLKQVEFGEDDTPVPWLGLRRPKAVPFDPNQKTINDINYSAYKKHDTIRWSPA